MREVWRNQEAPSTGLHTWRGHRETVGDVEQIDETEMWRKKVKDPDGDYGLDLR